MAIRAVAAAKNELDRLGPITRIPENMKAKYAMAALEYYMRFNREEIINDKDSLTRATIQSWKKYKDFLPADNWLYQYYEASLTDKDISNALYDIHVAGTSTYAMPNTKKTRSSPVAACRSHGSHTGRAETGLVLFCV